MVESPKSYNEMLAKLNTAAFLTTLVYCVMLVYFRYLPRVALSRGLVPPAKDYKELIEWILSFGVIPLLAALVAYFLSSAFEIHNVVSKVTRLRSFWDRRFIVRPLALRAQCRRQLSRKDVDKVMAFYYQEVANINQHYVHTFWRYALFFWVLFEHILFVLISLPFVCMLGSPSWCLLWYLAIVVALATLQFFFVTGQKSTAQANVIALDKVTGFFRLL